MRIYCKEIGFSRGMLTVWFRKEYFNLNISHRTLFEEIEKRAKKGKVIILMVY
jgi:hypothetical protein